MRIYCVNLADAVERRKKIVEQCSRYGLAVEMVEARNGRLMSDEDFRALVFNPGRNMLPKGDAACALTHLAIYETILNEGQDVAMIMEDDAVFESDPRPFIEAAGTADPERPDVFLMTDCKEYVASRKRILSGVTFHPALSGNNAHAYVITRKAAANMLRGNRPLKVTIDNWKYHILRGLIQVWVTKETFAVQAYAETPSVLATKRDAIRLTPEWKRYIKSARSLIPWSRRLRYYLWKAFVRPFETVIKEHGTLEPAPRQEQDART